MRLKIKELFNCLLRNYLILEKRWCQIIVQTGINIAQQQHQFQLQQLLPLHHQHPLQPPPLKLPPADGQTAPQLDEIDGDTILILFDAKAMLHNWPIGMDPYFKELQYIYNDIYSKFDFSGYWVKETVYHI